MKNEKGFSLIETLITTVVLATALVSLYVLFTNMMVKEKRRTYYDDPMYTIRSNYVFDVLFDVLQKAQSVDHEEVVNTIDFTDLLKEGNEENRTMLYLISFTCDSDIFKDKDECHELFKKMKLYKVYVSRFDTSYIYTCENSNSSACINYNLMSTQAKLYLKSLPYVPDPVGSPGANGYYIIFEYNETDDGGICGNENCMHEFASIKYGGTNQVIHLK